MKKLYTMDFDYGRMGKLQGMFVAEESDVENLIGKTLYFGEVLGKHSDIYGELEASDIVVVSDDQDFITKLVEVIGGERISGYNPFDYYEEGMEEL